MEDVTIPQEQILYGVIPPLDKFSLFAIGVDLAVSEATQSCYTVLTLVGKLEDTFYVIDFKRGRWISNIEKLDMVLEMYQKWHVPGKTYRFVPEKIAYQGSMVGDFNVYLKGTRAKECKTLVCMPNKLDGDKFSHLVSLTGTFARGKIIFNEKVNWAYYTSEFTEFGSVQFNDCVDSLCIALKSLGMKGSLQIPDPDNLYKNTLSSIA